MKQLQTATYKKSSKFGRLGSKDSPELCEMVLDQIPLEVLISAKRVLDPSCGYGGFADEYVRRVEPYIGLEEALSRIWLVDNHITCVNRCIKNGYKNVIHANTLTWEPQMKFDVVIANPPYNNKGKIEGQKQTSGTSLWLQFVKKIPDLMVDGGWCSLLLPSAVGNTNSQGWRSLKDMRIQSLSTEADKWFNVGTKISQITFTKEPPLETATHLLNGVPVDRRLIPILPASGHRLSVSIFSKISQFASMNWRRDNFPVFVKKTENKEVLAMSFLDRSKKYRMSSRNGIIQRENLKKVNICWVETKNPAGLDRILTSKLFSLFALETMFSGQISVGSMRALSLPEGWETLETDAEIYSAYGLTTEEIEYVESLQK